MFEFPIVKRCPAGDASLNLRYEHSGQAANQACLNIY
jgi:hypothetical protein